MTPDVQLFVGQLFFYVDWRDFVFHSLWITTLSSYFFSPYMVTVTIQSKYIYVLVSVIWRNPPRSGSLKDGKDVGDALPPPIGSMEETNIWTTEIVQDRTTFLLFIQELLQTRNLFLTLQLIICPNLKDKRLNLNIKRYISLTSCKITDSFWSFRFTDWVKYRCTLYPLNRGIIYKFPSHFLFLFWLNTNEEYWIPKSYTTSKVTRVNKEF